MKKSILRIIITRISPVVLIGWLCWSMVPTLISFSHNFQNKSILNIVTYIIMGLLLGGFSALVISLSYFMWVKRYRSVLKIFSGVFCFILFGFLMSIPTKLGLYEKIDQEPHGLLIILLGLLLSTAVLVVPIMISLKLHRFISNWIDTKIK